MASRYLRRLGPVRRGEFERQLWETQLGKCFICRDDFRLPAELDNMEIEHILPVPQGGRDRSPNFALIHSRCNQTTRPTDLNIVRGLHFFEKVQRLSGDAEDQQPNLEDILREFGGGQFGLALTVKDGKAHYSFDAAGDSSPHESPIYRDQLSGMDYFFAVIPIQYLHYENQINPRTISPKLKDLLEEFSKKRPQLHVSLGRLLLDGDSAQEVRVFDGQHKAAAQILLGVRELPVRVFINPDLDILMEANTNAGTVLRQVGFDKAVQRRLGGTVFWDRVRKYQQEHHLAEDDYSFSERDLVRYFRSDRRKLVRYIVDAVRDEISHNPNNKLRRYIDFGGKSRGRPLSYNTVDKTFYSFFIYRGILERPLSEGMESGEIHRVLEKEQLVRLINIIAEEIYIDRFDSSVGAYRTESRVQSGEPIPDLHLRAVRLSRDEVIFNWLLYVGLIIQDYFVSEGLPFDVERVLEHRFPETLWASIRGYVRYLKQLDIWSDLDLSWTVFGVKQSYSFWETVFQTGRLPTATRYCPKGSI